jgi:beta-glucosidase
MASWPYYHFCARNYCQVVCSRLQPTHRGAISIVLNSHFYEPYNAKERADVDAAQRRLEFYVGWFGDPIFLGKDYPSAMREHLGERLPEFTPDDLELLQETARANAFYGMNHYTTKFARALSEPAASDEWTGNIEETAINSEGKEIGPASGLQWLRTAPEGFRKLLNWVWDRYHLPIIITENGCPCPGEDKVETAVNDRFRQNYYGLYLDAISRAIYKDSIPVEGYCAWSLMDNFGSFAPCHHVLFETIVDFTDHTNTHQNGRLVMSLGLVSCMSITRPRTERLNALPVTSKAH